MVPNTVFNLYTATAATRSKRFFFSSTGDVGTKEIRYSYHRLDDNTLAGVAVVDASVGGDRVTAAAACEVDVGSRLNDGWSVEQ